MESDHVRTYYVMTRAQKNNHGNRIAHKYRQETATFKHAKNCDMAVVSIFSAKKPRTERCNHHEQLNNRHYL